MQDIVHDAVLANRCGSNGALSQNATSPVAFSANDGADEKRNSAIQRNSYDFTSAKARSIRSWSDDGAADDQPRILAALCILVELSQHRSEHVIPQRRAHAEVLCRESVVALVVL